MSEDHIATTSEVLPTNNNGPPPHAIQRPTKLDLTSILLESFFYILAAYALPLFLVLFISQDHRSHLVPNLWKWYASYAISTAITLSASTFYAFNDAPESATGCRIFAHIAHTLIAVSIVLRTPHPNAEGTVKYVSGSVMVCSALISYFIVERTYLVTASVAEGKQGAKKTGGPLYYALKCCRRRFHKAGDKRRVEMHPLTKIRAAIKKGDYLCWMATKVRTLMTPSSRLQLQDDASEEDKLLGASFENFA